MNAPFTLDVFTGHFRLFLCTYEMNLLFPSCQGAAAIRRTLATAQYQGRCVGIVFVSSGVCMMSDASNYIMSASHNTTRTSSFKWLMTWIILCK